MPETRNSLHQAGSSPVDMLPVTAENREDVVERLLVPWPDSGNQRARDFIAYAERTGIDLQHLYAARSTEGILIASVMVIIGQGRTGTFCCTPLTDALHVQLLARLIDCACRAIEPARMVLAQVLLETRPSCIHDAYRQAGFQDLATLQYMARRLTGEEPPAGNATPPAVSHLPYEENRRREFEATLAATYEATMDCPDLNGLRTPADILLGHRGYGPFDPSLWSLMHIEKKPVGIQLLNISPGGREADLAYVGLVPEVRGRGLGRVLMEHGLRLLRDRCVPLVTLAVDMRNTPALALYDTLGFHATQQRQALIRHDGR